MRSAIQKLSPRTEFFLIVGLCFGYFVLTSAAVLLRGLHEYKLTTPRVVRGIVIEIAIMVIAGWILHLRGWTFRRLGFQFSCYGLLAGVALFLVYIVLYWGGYLLVVTVNPAAQHLQVVKMVPAAPAALFILLIIVNSIFEEAAVTGYVVSALEEQGAALSITASTLIRFLYHLYQGPMASIAILPLGLLFALVYWRWRNLWPLMTAHTIVNILSFAMAASRGISQ